MKIAAALAGAVALASAYAQTLAADGPATPGLNKKIPDLLSAALCAAAGMVQQELKASRFRVGGMSEAIAARHAEADHTSISHLGCCCIGERRAP